MKYVYCVKSALRDKNKGANDTIVKTIKMNRCEKDTAVQNLLRYDLRTMCL